MSQGLPGHHDDPHAVLRDRARQVRELAASEGAEGESVPSPCVSVCRLDAQRSSCEGCLRTLDEIRAWRTLDDAGRRAVWRLIETRLDTLLQETP